MASSPKNKITFKTLIEIVKQTIQGVSDDNVTKLSASLAYATLFSLIPFITLIISIGAFFHQDIGSALYGQLGSLMGRETVTELQNIITNAAKTNSSTFASIISIGVMIFGATAIFAEIQTSLNRIWGIKPKPKIGWLNYLRTRLLSFSMILILGFLMLVSLSLTTFISSINERLMMYFPDVTAILFQVFGWLMNFAVIAILLILMFKMLPDAKIRFKDVMVGGMVTTALFLIGQFAISLYFRISNPTSVYGAAASVVLLLTWIYYSSIIIYVGAEFTKAWANMMGGKIYPDSYAVSTKTIEVLDDGPIETINKKKIDKTAGEQLSDLQM